MANRLVLAFDFGGTKLSAALVDVDDGVIQARRRFPTPVEEGAEACFQTLVAAGDDILAGLAQARGAEAIGVSFGGPLEKDRRTVLDSHHVPHWQGFPLPARLSEHFSLPAEMDNDGNTAALGEWRFGAGQSSTNMLYIQVSTGIGAGLFLNGRIYRGEGLAGEFGHMTIAPDGPQCTCGKRGCLESLASGWAIARDGRSALLSTSRDDPLQTVCGENPGHLDAEMVFQAARLGSQAAGNIISRAATHLAHGLANAICLLDPQVVVLGGGVMRAWDALEPLFSQALNDFLPSMSRGKTGILRARLAGSETLIGAALLTQHHQ